WDVTTRLIPCLMFANTIHGRAEEAMQAYTAIFPNSGVESIDRYTEQPGPIGKVVHGRFRLGGQAFTAMDSHDATGATFSEGLSLQIFCKDQRELDEF